MPSVPSASVRSDSCTRSSRSVDAFDHERPLGVAVELGYVPAPSPLELIGEETEKRRRAAAQRDHARRRAARLRSDRDDRRACGTGDEEERVAARQPAERPELVTRDEDEPRSDTATRELAERPPCGVALVGEADLDVLAVARHPRVRQAGRLCRVERDLDCDGETRDAGGPQTLLDRGKQLSDLRFGRIRPLRHWDQVDLAPVQPLRHDVGRDASACELRDRGSGCGVQRGIFLPSRLTPVEQSRARRGWRRRSRSRG